MSLAVSNLVGRPVELDAVKLGEICALLASGCSYRTAAKYVGCTAAAISMRAKRDAAFREQLEKSTAQREAILLSHLREASKKSWRATAYLLEVTVGGRFGGKHVLTLEEEVEKELHEEVLARMREPSGAEEDVAIRAGGSGARETAPAEEAAPANEPALENENAAEGGDVGEHVVEAVAKDAGGVRVAENSGRAVSKRAGRRGRGEGVSGDREIQLPMDVLERLWEMKDELEDAAFLDMDFEET